MQEGAPLSPVLGAISKGHKYRLPVFPCMNSCSVGRLGRALYSLASAGPANTKRDPPLARNFRRNPDAMLPFPVLESGVELGCANAAWLQVS